MRRAVCLSAVLALAAGLAACSTEDMAAFNAGLEAYNGVTYYDVTDSDATLECNSGYLTRHSGVRSNQQYVYFTSRTDTDVTVHVGDEAGGGASLYVPARGQSDTYWTYPSYSLDYEWTC